MLSESATKYIKQTRQEGFSDAEIRLELEKAGWQASDIDARPGDLYFDVSL